MGDRDKEKHSGVVPEALMLLVILYGTVDKHLQTKVC